MRGWIYPRGSGHPGNRGIALFGRIQQRSRRTQIILAAKFPIGGHAARHALDGEITDGLFLSRLFPVLHAEVDAPVLVCLRRPLPGVGHVGPVHVVHVVGGIFRQIIDHRLAVFHGNVILVRNRIPFLRNRAVVMPETKAVLRGGQLRIPDMERHLRHINHLDGHGGHEHLALVEIVADQRPGGITRDVPFGFHLDRRGSVTALFASDDQTDILVRRTGRIQEFVVESFPVLAFQFHFVRQKQVIPVLALFVQFILQENIHRIMVEIVTP